MCFAVHATLTCLLYTSKHHLPARVLTCMPWSSGLLRGCDQPYNGQLPLSSKWPSTTKGKPVDAGM